MYLPSDAHNILQDIKFYLTGGADTYHIYLGSKTQSQMVSGGWTHVSITFDSSENNGDVPYMAVLEPHYEEVFFRIQFDSKYSAGTNADEEYYLTNFEFKPKKSSNYVSSTSVVLSKTSLQLATGASYQLSAYVLPTNSTYKGIQWVSDSGAVIVSNDGLVTAVGKHGSTGTITAYSEDGTSLARCYVTINNWNMHLSEQYGFSNDIITKLYKLYNGISAYHNGDEYQKAYIFCRINGGFVYDEETGLMGTLFQTAAGDAISKSDVVTKYGLTNEEYDSLKQGIINQHNYTDTVSKIDFAHQMITMATIYNYNYSGESFVEEMLGWRGDTTIGDIPTMGTQDYAADLDAENICYIFNFRKQSAYSNKDFQCVFIEYYDDLLFTENCRVQTFIEHTSIEYIEQILFEYANVEEADEMLSNNKYRAAYNFIKNIKNYNDELVDYFEIDKNNQG